MDESLDFRCQSSRAHEKASKGKGGRGGSADAASSWIPSRAAPLLPKVVEGSDDEPEVMEASLTAEEEAELAAEMAQITMEADTFLIRVKAALASNPAEHERFMTSLMSFLAGAIDTVEMMGDAANLLEEYPQLLKGFNAFLPYGYRVERLPETLSHYAACHAVGTTLPATADATRLADGFVSRLCDHFSERPDVLRQLHAILRDASLEDPSVPSACPVRAPPLVAQTFEQLRPLLADAPDLARELLEYVPASCYSDGHVHIIAPVGRQA